MIAFLIKQECATARVKQLIEICDRLLDTYTDRTCYEEKDTPTKKNIRIFGQLACEP